MADEINPEFETALLELAMGDLRATEDPQLALRKALLVLLFITGDDAEREHRGIFRSFLLALFPPLAEQFVNHRHVLFGDVQVMRARQADDRLALFANVNRLSSALAERLGKRRRRPPRGRRGASAKREASDA